MLDLAPVRSTWRTFLAIIALALWATPGAAQAITSREIVSNWDADSATATYCTLSQNIVGVGRIKTTGSSATVDAATGTPFADVTAGGTITVSILGATPLVRYVLTQASSTQITVDTAIDLSAAGATGYDFSHKTIACGTGAGAGWFGVGNLGTKSISFSLSQLAVLSGSVAVTVQCRGSSPWSQPVPVYPPTGGTGPCGTGLFTVAGATAACTVDFGASLAFSQCRVGVALTDDATDTTTALERFSATLEGR